MKDIKKILLSGAFLCLLLTSCNGGNPTSSEPNSENVTSENASSELTSSNTSSESSSSEESISLNSGTSFAKALENTTRYSLKSADTTSERYYEILEDDLYYYGPAFQGYILLDNDSNHFHSYSVRNTKIGEEYVDVMNVYGRAFRARDYESVLTYTMYDILYYYQDLFIESIEGSGKYICTDKSITSVFEEFFQQKLIGSCNYFEVIVENNRFTKINFYEYYRSILDIELMLSCKFEQNDGKNAKFYKHWLENGKPETVRIRDIKPLFSKENDRSTPETLYEDETVTLNATVTAIDVLNNMYIAQNDENMGPIGLEVKLTETIPDLNVGDDITIKGKIKTEVITDINTYMYDAKITKLGTSQAFAPIYDEDYMVDTYGGGTYAALMFANDLKFGGSVYSTYAYVLEIPTEINKNADIFIQLICPNIVDIDKRPFVLDLVIPKDLDDELKTSMLETITNAGIYSNTVVNNAKELSLENVIIDYNFSYNLPNLEYRGIYPVALIATNDSIVSNKLTLSEKFASYFGFENLPILNEQNVSYKFGGASGLFIESVYGDYENTSKTGLFVSYQGVNLEDFLKYENDLLTYGFSKYDEIKDISRCRHYIYTYNNLVLDFSLESADNVLLCWAYEAPIVKLPSIEEALKAQIGSWFDVENDFARLSSTSDADYTLYSLKSYAGIDFSDNPLTVLALDLNENRYTEYLQELVQNLGYKQYRNPENNRPASYIVRGSTHQAVYNEEKNIFIDVALYTTDEYTYTGHNEWTYRIELVFINGNAPLDIPTYDNLDLLTNMVKENIENAYFNPTLPSDAVVEYWLEESGSIIDRDVTYGYGSRNEAFIYTSDIDGCYDAIVSSLFDAGYSRWGETTNAFQYIEKDGKNEKSQIIVLLKEETKGYVRVINGTGGFDFWR